VVWSVLSETVARSWRIRVNEQKVGLKQGKNVKAWSHGVCWESYRMCVYSYVSRQMRSDGNQHLLQHKSKYHFCMLCNSRPPLLVQPFAALCLDLRVKSLLLLQLSCARRVSHDHSAIVHRADSGSRWLTVDMTGLCTSPSSWVSKTLIRQSAGVLSPMSQHNH
jgi:hypothetical protein